MSLCGDRLNEYRESLGGKKLTHGFEWLVTAIDEEIEAGNVAKEMIDDFNKRLKSEHGDDLIRFTGERKLNTIRFEAEIIINIPEQDTEIE